MSNLSLLETPKTPSQLTLEVAAREKALRRRLGITQEELAQRAGVTLGSLRRFEQTGAIAFESLVRLMRALDCEAQLDGLFSRPAWRSIEEVIHEQA